MKFDDDWRCCCLCKRPYSSNDVSAVPQEISQNEDYGALPVQSSVCSHMLCFSCVQKPTETALRHPDGDLENNDDGYPCPICWKENAFRAKRPIISTSTCTLLRELILLQQRQSFSSCFSVQNNIQTLKSTYQPDLYIYNQEPLPFDHSSKESLSSEDESCDNIVNFKGKKNATSTTTTNNYSARNDTLEPPSVRRQSLPGAVWIDGPHLNTSTVMTTDEYDASEEPQGLAVATLVQEPLTVPAKLVVPLSVKYRRWLLVFMVGVVLVTCIILAITLKNVSRNNQLKHIAFQISNQTNYNSLGAPQREAIKWLLGKNNTNLDPKKDQSQLAQRYQLATLYFSTSGGNWSNTISNPNVLSSENECTWDPQWISCSDDRKVVTIKIGTCVCVLEKITSCKVVYLRRLEISTNFRSFRSETIGFVEPCPPSLVV